MLMSNPDPDKILFSTRYKYFLNKTTATGTINLPATALNANETANFTLSIPIENKKNYTQIRINFSHDSLNWRIFPFLDITLDANCTIATIGSYVGSNLELTFFVINQVGAPITTTSTNVTVKVYVFESPK